MPSLEQLIISRLRALQSLPPARKASVNQGRKIAIANLQMVLDQYKFQKETGES